MPKAQGAKRRFKDTHTQHGMTYNYMLTISKHRKKDYVTEGELLLVLKTLKQQLNTLEVICMSFENSGLYEQLHFHAVVTLKKQVYYKKYNSLLGFRLQWSPITDCYEKGEQVGGMRGAIAYVTKQAYSKESQEAILVANVLLKGPSVFVN